MVVDEIKIIGAGLGRTGTQSLLQALTILGYKPYHMKEGVFETPGQMYKWKRLREGAQEGYEDLVDSMLEAGFNATLDMPVSHFSCFARTRC